MSLCKSLKYQVNQHGFYNERVHFLNVLVTLFRSNNYFLTLLNHHKNYFTVFKVHKITR
jgi:hypothetical protein